MAALPRNARACFNAGAVLPPLRILLPCGTLHCLAGPTRVDLRSTQASGFVARPALSVGDPRPQPGSRNSTGRGSRIAEVIKSPVASID